MKKFSFYGFGLIVLIVGFLVGRGEIKMEFPENFSGNFLASPFCEEEEEKPKPVIKLQKISGDEIFVDIEGEVKIVWSEENIIETKESSLPDIYKIPVGQIPTEQDLKLSQFKYVGNAKTGKFYPSSSYPARGTEAKHRRFFQTKAEARNAGFKATKLVK